ncbi:hypothetical protein [Pelagibacterium sp. H642]|uniref:hypothetical protein n=1 Tax=Pelagibacterium sp. H642 TaxID=1881069 RepID=UPI0028159C20|nr:hypothetical protein [Pelagibacterium sp. H642]WMT90152.1 hypothetical protein NO934_15340 [Pelagibacterium sp. H642]
MAGLLDTNALKDITGAAFAPVLGTGQLIRIDMVRQPGGVIIPTEQPPVAISVQVDRCDEAMRQSPGYTEQDVKLIILQSGVTGREPNSDDVVVARGERWKCKSVRSDPAQSHWTIHATRDATEE